MKRELTIEELSKILTNAAMDSLLEAVGRENITKVLYLGSKLIVSALEGLIGDLDPEKVRITIEEKE